MKTEIHKYCDLITEKLTADYTLAFREAVEPFEYPFLVPGSEVYNDVLWDWDSWLSDIALRQILLHLNSTNLNAQALPFEQGCVLNYLSWCRLDGWIPVVVSKGDNVENSRPDDIFHDNMHKPVLAQHAAFLIKEENGDAEWLREKFPQLQAFVNNYMTHHRHRCGLYYWQNDFAIGVDNDPCTYFRPPKSSGSIFLNCLMYKELQATSYICDCLNMDEVSAHYHKQALLLKESINKHCWDDRDGFYYSVDLNLLPNDKIKGLHQNMPRTWDCLIQRIGVWSGFLALWSGIATPQQAERVVFEHFRNINTFNAHFGVRSLSKMEKMYNICATSNPSNWLGPIWGVVNYFTFRGLLNYGFMDDAKELAEKTVMLFGRDLERFGQLHEYYQPDNGEPILNRGFQNWNHLVVNMSAWLNGNNVVTEF